MALATILDFLHDWPGQAKLELSYGDEMAETGGGAVLTRELRPPLWTLDARSRLLRPNDLSRWQATVEALENGKRQVVGFDRNRYYPINYPNGSWPTGVAFDGHTSRILTVGADNKSMSLDSLPAGYEGSVGDMLAWQYNTTQQALHRVMEDFTANGSGVTGVFEVRPHIRPTATVTTVAHVKRPACLMVIIPGTISVDIDDLGWGTVNFQAQQTLP